MDESKRIAYRCNRVLDPLHSLVYFAPDAEAALTKCGLKPGRMCYFASRSAPMGAVGPGTVAATFYNFNPELIARHIPLAWTLAAPEQVLAARFDAADIALRRLLGEDTIASAEVAEASELAQQATAGCTVEGRPLYGAHADLDWPTEPHLVLWHAITLLREFRGDGHIAALVAYRVSGLAALISHTATGRGFQVAAAKATRGWSDEQWAAGVEALRAKGLLDEDGALTEAGEAMRNAVEQRTNEAAVAPWQHLGAAGCERLHELGRALSKRAVAAGAYPPELFADAARSRSNSR